MSSSFFFLAADCIRDGHVTGVQTCALPISPYQTPFVIGRDALKADLQIVSGLASRDHCHIVFRRGKYVLVEHSTNGTYVKIANQTEIYLRREALPLLGSGYISLGRSPDTAGHWLIHYRL